MAGQNTLTFTDTGFDQVVAGEYAGKVKVGKQPSGSPICKKMTDPHL
jgi:hypothetical protein